MTDLLEPQWLQMSSGCNLIFKFVAFWPDLCGCVFEVWPSPGALECFQTCGGKILSIFSEAFPDAVPNLSEFRPSFDRFLKGKASKSASYALRFRTMTRSDRHGTVYQDNPNSIDRRPAYDCLWPTGILHPMRITTQTMMSDLDLIYYTILYYTIYIRSPSKTTGLVLQCRLHPNSARQTNYTAVSWCQTNPASMPSSTHTGQISERIK